jgi:hypothetical protein
MDYVLVCYLFGIVSLVIGRYTYKHYRGELKMMISMVFGVIGIIVIIFSIIITTVMVRTHRSY